MKSKSTSNVPSEDRGPFGLRVSLSDGLIIAAIGAVLGTGSLHLYNKYVEWPRQRRQWEVEQAQKLSDQNKEEARRKKEQEDDEIKLTKEKWNEVDSEIQKVVDWIIGYDNLSGKIIPPPNAPRLNRIAFIDGFQRDHHSKIWKKYRSQFIPLNESSLPDQWDRELNHYEQIERVKHPEIAEREMQERWTKVASTAESNDIATTEVPVMALDYSLGHEDERHLEAVRTGTLSGVVTMDKPTSDFSNNYPVIPLYNSNVQNLIKKQGGRIPKNTTGYFIPSFDSLKSTNSLGIQPEYEEK